MGILFETYSNSCEVGALCVGHVEIPFWHPALLTAACLLFSLLFTQAQQTLGGITGTVMESTGSVLPGTVVTIVGDETTLTRTRTGSATEATIS